LLIVSCWRFEASIVLEEDIPGVKCQIYIILHTISYIYINSCLCPLTVTRLILHVELKLPSRLEHLILPRCFSGVRVAPFLIFCVVFCGSMFVRLFPFLWSLCYLSFKLRFLITNLVSSNSSYNIPVRMLTLLFVDEIMIII
jgi:hypothetical protein